MDQDALPSRIASEIATMIVAGDFSADDRLTTQSLAERFEVSRTPVRSALAILEQRGLVTQQPNRGYFVNSLTSKVKTGLINAVGNGSRDGPRIYYALAEDWLCNAVPEEVTETYLLQRYKVSRSELTEALRRGAAEGWIERKAGYGWRLLPVAKTPEAQEQLYRMRLLLEPAGFLEPTFMLDRPVVERLHETLERMRDGAHVEWPADRLHAIGVSFHEELSRMSGNPFLHQALVRVNRMRRLLEYRSMIDRNRVLQETHEHLGILEPLLAGDLVETSFRMRAHVMKALDRKRPAQGRRP